MASVAIARHQNQFVKIPNSIFMPKDPIFGHHDFNRSELWAGPAYSNSPPPTSLPIPTFPLCKKRGVYTDSNSSATENLRRILNLDVGN